MQRRLQADCQNNDNVSRDYSHVDQQTQTEEQISEGPRVCKQSQLKIPRSKAVIAHHVCTTAELEQVRVMEGESGKGRSKEDKRKSSKWPE